METLISIMSIVFSNSTPKIPKTGIFGSKFKILMLSSNLTIKKIRGCWLQTWKKFFEIAVQNTQIRHFGYDV